MPIESRMLKSFTLACLLSAVIGVNQHAGAKENVRYPNVVLPGATIEPVTVRAEIYRPPGNGVFPAVIVLHGCGGHDAHHERWAERLDLLGRSRGQRESDFANVGRHQLNVRPFNQIERAAYDRIVNADPSAPIYEPPYRPRMILPKKRKHVV